MHAVRTTLGRSSNALLRQSARRLGLHSRTIAAHPTRGAHSSATETLFANLWNAKDLDSIRASCSALVQRLKSGDVKPPSNPTCHQQIRTVLASLTESDQEEDARRIIEVLHDVYPMLGLTPSRADYMFVFQRLLNHGHHEQALGFLLNMKNLPGSLVPELGQFHRLLESWSKYAPFDVLRGAVEEFSHINPDLSNETFLLLLDAFFWVAAREEKTFDFDGVSSFVRWCVGRGMTSDPVVASKLFQGYVEAGDLDAAKRIVAVYELVTRPHIDLDDTQVAFMAEPSSSSSDQALNLLKDANSYADIAKVSKLLNFSCQAPHYGIAIANCVKAGKYEGALDVYSKSQEAGIIPTAGMVLPLIRSLYQGHFLESTDEAVDKALAIYQNLCDAWPHNEDGGPTAKIYYALIRMVLSSPNTDKYLPAAQSLLHDMESRGHTDNPSFLAASKIIVEMRLLGSFARTMDFYRQHRSHLDQMGFIQVLQEYCRLSFSGDLEVPLITEYFSIINHMRAQNVPMTPKVYTIILHQIGVIAAKLRYSGLDQNLPRGSIYQRLVDTTRRIHHFLTLDASVSPDAILWNQLMNTYQRLGLFRDMEKLWQTMYLSGRFDQRTINIMIDACGYSGNLRFVRSIIAKLLKAGHKLDGRNWDTLVEALCRNLHFGEALEVVCVEMKKHEVEPQTETIRIFRKFGRKHGVWNLYKPSIENALPELWRTLPDEIRET